MTISHNGQIMDVNEATEKVTGIKRKSLIGSDFSAYFTEPDKASAGYQQVLSEGFVNDYPLTIRHTSGRTIDVLYNATVYRNEAGEVQGVFAAARDITQRKKAEQALERYLDRQKLLLETSTRAMMQINLDDLLNTVSDEAREMCGARYAATGHGYVNGNFITGGASRAAGSVPCPPGEVFSVEKGGIYMDLIEKQQSIRLTDAQMRAHPAWWGLPAEHVPMRGLLGARLVNAKGEPNGILMVTDKADGSDFTEEDEASLKQLAVIASLALQHVEARTLAEKRAVELQETFRYARSLLEASLDPLVTISPEGKVTDVNQATEAVSGLSREQLIGSNFSDYFTQPEQANQGYHKVLAEGLVRDYPLTIRHTSGALPTFFTMPRFIETRPARCRESSRRHAISPRKRLRKPNLNNTACTWRN